MALPILIKSKLEKYFTQPPCLNVVLYLSSHYLSGLHLSSKERKIKNYFISSLQEGVIKPSFNQKNIKNENWLKEGLKQGIAKLNLSDKKAACLIPELSLKAFVFSFNSLPLAKEEREELIRFRVRKQMALMPNDVRFSYDVIKSNSSQKVVVAMARASVIKEYEDLLEHLGLKVRTVNSPLFGLFNLSHKEKNGDYLVVNIESDSLGLLAVTSSEVSLYRQKPFDLNLESKLDYEVKIDDIIKEIENTANFIEDKEKKKINFILLRLGLSERREELLTALKDELSLPLKMADVPAMTHLKQEERRFLSPLAGQIQC